MRYIFQSQRLGFRNFQKSDSSTLFHHHSEKEHRHWFPNENYSSMEEAFGAIRLFRKNVRRQTLPYVLAIESLETREVIGDIGINEVWDKNDDIEIGYSICEKHRGHGYATEAVIAMSAFVASKFRVKTLFSRVLKGNGTSCRVLEKSGFNYQGIETGAPDDPHGSGMLVYKIHME